MFICKKKKKKKKTLIATSLGLTKWKYVQNTKLEWVNATNEPSLLLLHWSYHPKNID
jgi:hypothetical protein